MSRLIVASNRVTDLSGPAKSGGLAVAMGDALSDLNGIWFGWSGEIVPEGSHTGLNLERQADISTATQPLTDEEYKGYYLGYANRVLWPVFHNRLDIAEFVSKHFTTYKSVNQRFAQSLSALVDKDDLVWIHDYQLIPLAAELRKLGVKNRIGFYLHIPFPPAEILAAVPDHEWLIDSLFACDVIGFQTDNCLENFKRYVDQTKPSITPDTHPFRSEARNITMRAYPIGIDVDAFAAMAHSPEADERIKRLKRGTTRHYVIGVDRLDYTKGLPDRFRAYKRFLEHYPKHRKNTVLMQVASPTREELTAYVDIKAELERLTGQINGAFGDFDWTPVRYLHRHVPRDTLAAIFRGSKVGLVTPLRDGMNLVAKEYVAAQDVDDPGVLILSQFAGAAWDLKEALIVNPYDADDISKALNTAVTMPRSERKLLHEKLLARIKEHDVTYWRKTYVSDLRGDTASAGAGAMPDKKTSQAKSAKASGDKAPEASNQV